MLSIIVPVYGQLHLLMACLASISQTLTSEAELILVDDCTPDFNLMDVPLPVTGKVVRMEKNVGFAQACNAGAKIARGETLLFLNSDTEAHAGWQQPLLDGFERDVAIVGPKLVFPAGNWCPLCKVYYDKQAVVSRQAADGRMLTVCPAHQDVVVQDIATIQSCGGWYDAGKGPYHRYLGWRADAPQVNVRERVSWITGAAMALRADVFKSAGGFDPAYGVGYFEDVDLCERVKQAGWTIMYVPESCFTHLVAQSTGSDKRDETTKRMQFYANSKLFHQRWDAAIVPDNKITRYVGY